MVNINSDIYSIFSDYKDEFITELDLQQKDGKTIDAYQSILDNFLEYIYYQRPIKELEDINHRVIVKFIKYQEEHHNLKKMHKNEKVIYKPFSYHTNMMYKKALKLFFDFIEEEGEIKLHIKYNKIKFKKDQQEVKSISSDQQIILKKYLSNLYRKYTMTKDKNNLSNELKSLEYIYTVNLAYKLGLYGALRAEEICTLKLSSFSNPYIDNKFLIIDILVEGKGHKQRIVPILYKYIQKEIEYFKTIRNDSEILLKNLKGKDITRHNLYYYFSEVAKYAKLNIKGIHILRHTCTMNMRENGIGLGDAQDFLGHSSPSVTRVYYRKSQSAMRGVAKKMG